MIKSIIELKENNLRGKKVLLRVDFNVPINDGKISEFYRVTAVKETINYLINNGAIVVILSHITAIKSFEPILDQIEKIFGRGLIFISDFFLEKIANTLASAKSGDIFMLDNIRQYEGEEKNDAKFAKKIALSFDIYVNDAFAVCHREHASVSAITKFLPSYAGFLIVKEVENLNKAVNSPKEEKTLIIGGAKIDTKFPVIKNFIDKAENILIGGAVANVFLKASGIDIKKSLTDDKFSGNALDLINSNNNLVIPEDYIISDEMILDIGPKATEKFLEIIKKSKVIIWNGPLGKSEIEKFSYSSKKIAEAIISSNAFSVIGGGDTVAFVEKINSFDRFNYVSTGGGAMLQFLAGNKLPGLEGLKYYDA